MYELKQMERYLPVNLLVPGFRLIKKRIYWAAVSQRLRNTALKCFPNTFGRTPYDKQFCNPYLLPVRAPFCTIQHGCDFLFTVIIIPLVLLSNHGVQETAYSLALRCTCCRVYDHEHSDVD